MKEVHFEATIVDVNLSSRIGVYSSEHPYYIVIAHPNKTFFDEVIPLRTNYYLEPEDPDDESTLIKSYKRIITNIAKKDYDATTFPEIKLPLISYLEESCTSDRFLNLLDQITGEQKDKFQSFNTIVIALGDDDTNINLANVIINDARKELLRGNQEHSIPQLIAVHIGNPNNNFKLQTAKASNVTEKSKLESLNVIQFGNVSQLYCFDKIVDEKFAKTVDAGYEKMSNHVYNLTAEIKEKMKVSEETEISKNSNGPNLPFKVSYEQLKTLEQRFNDDFSSTITYLYNQIAAGVLNEKKWLEKNSFKKESNSQVLLYELTMKAFMSLDISQQEKIKWFSTIEHIRWNRFYIANGWRFKKTEMLNTYITIV